LRRWRRYAEYGCEFRVTAGSTLAGIRNAVILVPLSAAFYYGWPELRVQVDNAFRLQASKLSLLQATLLFTAAAPADVYLLQGVIMPASSWRSKTGLKLLLISVGYGLFNSKPPTGWRFGLSSAVQLTAANYLFSCSNGNLWVSTVSSALQTALSVLLWMTHNH